MAHILIIENDFDIRQLLTVMFRYMGHEPIAVADGNQAIVFTQNLLPDLIVLDMMMPGLDGIAVAQHMRSGRQTASIPILALTAQTNYADADCFDRFGVDAVLIKPFEYNQLRAQVASLLEASGERYRALGEDGQTG